MTEIRNMNDEVCAVCDDEEPVMMDIMMDFLADENMSAAVEQLVKARVPHSTDDRKRIVVLRCEPRQVAYVLTAGATNAPVQITVSHDVL